MTHFDTRLTFDRIYREKHTGNWVDQLIIDYSDRAASTNPQKIAIIDSRGSCSFEELKRLSVRCACGLLGLGIRAGDVISLQLPNWREWTILHLAATRIGAITNPLAPIFRERELTFMLEVCGSTMLAITKNFRGFDHASLAVKLREGLKSLTHVLVIDGEAPPGCLCWNDFMATPWEESVGAEELEEMRPAPNSVTEIIFTSGTTGVAKGVLHTHNTLTAPINAIIDVLKLMPEDVCHMVSTFGHQTGFHGGVRLPLHLGATVVYQDVWNPIEFLKLVQQHRITITNGGPTFLQDLLQCPNLATRDLGSLRIFRCGGAPIPRVLIQEALVKLPQMSVHSAWGQTENAFVTITRPGDCIHKIADTDGRAQRGMEVRVVDTEGETVSAGIEGRLQCCGAFLFVGYAKRPDLNVESFEGEWFNTGDLATMDEEGFIRITGRERDVIIRGGENIPVAYVENVLYEDPRIVAVAIVAMSDPRLGERACAFIELRSECSLDLIAMQAHLDSRKVAKQYWPERLVIIEDMPRSANGKIVKALLRARLKEGKTS